MAQQQQHTGRLAAPSANGNDANRDATVSMQPSSADLEQAMAHLNRIASLLDSRTASSSSSSQPPSFPGLIEILPHLLNPLAEITRSTSASNGGAVLSQQGGSGSRNPAGGSIQSALTTQPPSSLGTAQAQNASQAAVQIPHPSAIIATYRPLVMQVRALLSQLGGCVAAAAAPIEQQTSMPSQASSSSSSASTSSLQVAEWAHDRHRCKRQKKRARDQDDGEEEEEKEGKGDVKAMKEGPAVSKEEKREAILRTRRERRQREEGGGRTEQQPQQGGAGQEGGRDGAATQGIETKTEEAAQSGGQQQQQSLDTAMSEGGTIPGGPAHPPPPQQQRPLVGGGGAATSIA